VHVFQKKVMWYGCGHMVTGYTLEGDQELQRMFGKNFLIPHHPQTVLEEAGGTYGRIGKA
jgi:hypothetical protein